MHQSFHFWLKWPFTKEGTFHVQGTTDSNNEPFTMEQMGMPFMLLATGTAAALLGFVGEVMASKIERKREEKKKILTV